MKLKRGTRATSRPAPDPKLSWRIVADGRETAIQLEGEIDETFTLDPVFGQITGPVILDLAGVRRINSAGVREWLGFIQSVTRANEVTLSRCSLAFVMQMNMINNFRGSAKVKSILAPYSCPNCLSCEDRLLDLQAEALVNHRSPLPASACGACGAMMQFDELPERYLSFLAVDYVRPLAPGSRTHDGIGRS